MHRECRQQIAPGEAAWGLREAEAAAVREEPEVVPVASPRIAAEVAAEVPRQTPSVEEVAAPFLVRAAEQRALAAPLDLAAPEEAA